MNAPGPAFGRFLLNLKPGFKTFHGINVLDSYKKPEVKELVKTFCGKYYSEPAQRVLVLGINPGRKGGGLTGLPFTDPVALHESCGIPNVFKQQRELSSTFIYKLIHAFGGPSIFYRSVLLSAVCPVGFTRNEKNCNYYDDPRLLKKLSSFLMDSFRFHAELGVNTAAVISLGKENGEYISRLNDESGLFKRIIVLEHPRFVMQYKRPAIMSYVGKYMEAIGSLT